MSEEIKNELFNNYKHSIGISRLSRISSTSKLMPERIKLTVEMMESDDEDETDNDDNNDNNDDNVEDDITKPENSPYDYESRITDNNLINDSKIQSVEKLDKKSNNEEICDRLKSIKVTDQTSYQEQKYLHEVYNKNIDTKELERSVGFTSDFGRAEIDSKILASDDASLTSGVFSASFGISKSCGVTGDTGSVSLQQSTGLSSASAQMSAHAASKSAPNRLSNQTYDLMLNQRPEASILSTTTNSNVKYEVLNGHRVSAHDNYATLVSKSDVNSAQPYTHSLPSIKSESAPAQATQTAANVLLETPMKPHPPPGNMRPTPSYSHRNIFQTPQNKMPGNYPLNQSIAATPATIFSHWQNMMQTSGQKSSIGGVHGSIIKPDSYGYRNTEGKSVRRPLAETVPQQHREIENHQRRSEPPNRQILECIPESGFKNSLRQESKSRHPTLPENSSRNEESLKKSIEFPLDNKQIQWIGKIGNSGMNELYSDVHNAVNKPNVVASVPISIKQPSQSSKIITVKGKNYSILGKLGQGMSGEVFRVQDMTNLELRAVKCVDLSRIDKEAAQSSIQEITMLAKLQGPSIVQMFDYEIKNYMIYVVMEMGDTDFSKLLKSMMEEKKLPLSMILYYWTEMLSAVKFIHDHGVIHSDLKPANFLLVRGRLKLIDFGIASCLNADMTSIVKNSTVGTLNYISPEALMDTGESTNHGKYKISYTSDVWSLGCILYSLVYGWTPFHHIRQQWAKINAITNPESKISFNQPNNSTPIPTILIDVMKKCLQHNPKARPSVEQLLQIHYIPINDQQIHIPMNILVKIKGALNTEEWQQFIEIMHHR